MTTANTSATEAINLKIGVASIHLPPSTMRTISSANRALVMVIGIVKDMNNDTHVHRMPRLLPPARDRRVMACLHTMAYGMASENRASVVKL